MGAETGRIFVGDVHGCADELDELLDRLAPDPDRHALWFVGDLVNRGPASLRALRRVREVARGAVLGNHDIALLRTAAGERSLRPRDTLQEILTSPDRDQLLEWLRTRPLLVEWEDVVLVHAGLHPQWDCPAAEADRLESVLRSGGLPSSSDRALSFFTRVRHCDARGGIPEGDRSPPATYVPWDHHYRGDRIVVCGHWAARGLVRSARLRSLDSGCVWGGSLTAWIADEDRFVSVKARRAYQTPRA